MVCIVKHEMNPSSTKLGEEWLLGLRIFKCILHDIFSFMHSSRNSIIYFFGIKDSVITNHSEYDIELKPNAIFKIGDYGEVYVGVAMDDNVSDVQPRNII